MSLSEFAADGVTVGEGGYVGETQEKLVEVRFECLSRLVTAANEHRCDLLVVAGDPRGASVFAAKFPQKSG